MTWMTGLLKTAILDRLQWWKKNKFWSYSGGILLLSWIPKSWKTLSSFHRLLIQPHRTNGLEVMKFCAPVKLLKTELDSTTIGSTKFWRLSKTETPGLPNTIPLGNSLRFSMVCFTTPKGQWLTGIGKWSSCWIRENLDRPDLPTCIRILAKFHHDLPRNLYTKYAINEHRFTPVIHTAYSDTWFGHYEFLKSGYSAELILDRLNTEVKSQV
jgi:hypothetical protein